MMVTKSFSSSSCSSRISKENVVSVEALVDNGRLPESGSGINSRCRSGTNAWNKPIDGENVPAAVMGASSWPALSNSLKAISASKETSMNSVVDDVTLNGTGSRTTSTMENSVAPSPAPAQSESFDSSSGENLSLSNADSGVLDIDSASVISTPKGTATNCAEIGSSHKSASGVGPTRQGPPRPSRQCHHHRSYQYNPRHPPQQRAREPFPHDNANHSNSENSNRYVNRRQQNRFHDFSSGRGLGPRPHPLFHSPQHGLPNRPPHFVGPVPSPQHPYPNISFQFYNAPFSPHSCYGFPGFGESPYLQENSWHFYPPPYVDMMGGIFPGSAHPSALNSTLTNHPHAPVVNPQIQTSPMNSWLPSVSSSQGLPSCPEPQISSSATHEAHLDNASSKPVSKPELCKKLRTQIEYYFSDENLMKDEYLKRQMDAEGWVSVYLIAGFRRVKGMTEDVSLIVEALQPSSCVEVQGDKMRKCLGGVSQAFAGDSRGSYSSFQEDVATQLQNLKMDEGPRMSVVSAQIHTIDCSKESVSAT